MIIAHRRPPDGEGRSARRPAGPPSVAVRGLAWPGFLFPASEYDREMPGGEGARPPSERREALKELLAQARSCERCSELAASRRTVVFGSGNADADLMFVGEAPGASEDEQGLPFVGRAGKLLDQLLAEIGMQRSEAWAARGIQQCHSGLCTAWYRVANSVMQGCYVVARLVCLLGVNLVNMFWLLITQLRWGVCRLVNPNKKKQDRIEHVFVLMLENRSFDHMLGLSNIQGIDALSSQPTASRLSK